MHCYGSLSRTGYHHLSDNQTVLRLAGRFPFRHATSFSFFTPNGLLQHLLHRLKYQQRKENGYFLGCQLGYDLQKTDWIQEVDLLAPVPLFPARERKRGYNQSVLIAAGMSEALHIPVQRDALRRVRNTESQVNKKRPERIKNVASAFAVRQAHVLRDKHVLLIDDVLTTGATLEACAAALLLVPGLSLSIATIGIAVD
jgi:ComF family protein